MNTSSKQVALDSRALLILYLIVPICVLIALIDVLIFDSQLKLGHLPSQPDEWFLWALLFNLPHIISSFVTLADKEYLQHYRSNFLPALLIIILIAGIVIAGIQYESTEKTSYYTKIFVFLMYALFTTNHVLAQQFGIAVILMKSPPTSEFKAVKLISIVGAVYIYLALFIPSSNQIILLTYPLLFLSGCILYFGILAVRSSKTTIGKYYLLLNMAMLLAIFFLAALDYVVFVLLIPRFVHDISAFLIYSNHDLNRNSTVKKNFIYRTLYFIPLPYLILVPLIGVVLAGVLERFLVIFFGVLFVLDFYHYYIETKIWKKEGLHRFNLYIR